MARAVNKHLDDCIACGLCVQLCPAIFAEADDKPIIAKPQVDPVEEDCVQEAIDSCPVSCIYWE